jgi:hypothetical protein
MASIIFIIDLGSPTIILDNSNTLSETEHKVPSY